MNTMLGWEIPKPTKKIKPLGETSPYAWGVEPSHGCNLRCGHCSCRLNPVGEFEFMTEETWRATFTIINAVTPTCRVDLCIGGEPTMHPRLPEFLTIAKSIAPKTQIQITTNGTQLLKGRWTYRQLLDAGANIVYTDMYGPRERFEALAKESGTQYYYYYDKPAGAPSPWTYHGPELKLIVLQEQPAHWPKSRLKAGLLGTWYNNLDWKAAARFGLKPVTEPIVRRCNQPFIHAMVHANGSYLLCCQDNMGETAGDFGSVHEGLEGFKRFWYGERLQLIRRRLRQKNRADSPQCKRCCITFSRCDYKHWTDDQVAKFWDGAEWKPLPDEPGFDRFAKEKDRRSEADQLALKL
jgi:hypothetical protein